MRDDTSTTDDDASDDGLPLSRRAALTLLGAGGVAAATGNATATHSDGGTADTRPWNQHVDANDHDLTNVGAFEADDGTLGSLDVGDLFTAAREADVVVWKDDDGAWYADGRDGRVATGTDVMAVTQTAVDSLTDDRDWKEKVLVASPGTATGDVDRIALPSYTVLDVPFRIHVPHPEGADQSEDVEYVVYADDVEHIEVPRLTVTGAPWMGMRIRQSSDVKIGDFRFRAPEDSETNDALRIDDHRGSGRSEDVQINSVFVENSGHHAVETVDVHRFEVEQVIGKNPGGCAVLLNTSTDATVNSVAGLNPGGGYATVRLANGNENVSIGNVVARGGYRGIAIITDARHVTVGEVNIVGCKWDGIQLVDATNVTIGEGVVRNCGGDGVTIYSHLGEPANEGITVSDLRIVDDREEPEMEYAINESGDSRNNRFVNNDLREGGTRGLINVGSGTTVVRGNMGAGLDEGTATLHAGSSPAARVEGVTYTGSSALDARVQPVRTPKSAFGIESRFEWTGEQWDLVLEWTTDPGTDVEVSYVVDRDQPNLAGVETGPPSEWNPDEVDQESGAGVIDDFEDGNLSEYVGSTGSYDVNEDAPVPEGDFSLKNIGGSDALIGSFGGLDRYPAAGDTFAAKAASTDTAQNFGLLFGMQDLSNFYFTRYWKGGPELQIYHVVDGSYNKLAGTDVSETDVGTVYDYVVDWAADGTMSLELRDGDGNAIQSVTAQDTTWSEGGIGTRRAGMLDDVRITDAGSN